MSNKVLTPRSAAGLALSLRNGAGGGVHKSKPRYEPTVEEFLDEMEEEHLEQDKLLAELFDESDGE